MLSCQTAQSPKSSGNRREDLKGTIGTVAGALAGSPLNDAELKRLEHELRTDEKARSAVEAIGTSMKGQQTGRIKYSPATGKRYAPHMEYDPETGVRLEYLK